jgi:hypothetical protein
MKKYTSLLTAMATLTVIFGTIYVVAQQSARLAANDVPTQLAQEATDKLSQGQKPADVVGKKVELAHSLNPFVIVYNQKGQPVAGSGYLHGRLPTIPYGVLKSTATGQEHTVTWQPEAGVRIASVTVKEGDYYVVGGQSLRPTESRLERLLGLTAFGWLATITCVLVGYAIRVYSKK